MEQNEAAPTLASRTLEVSGETLATSRRLIESVLIAVATSAGLYLVGSVYTDAYYGRMSIEVLSLDLSPPYVTLQAAHALQGLLEYPSILVILFILSRALARPIRWLRTHYDWARRRSERVVILLTNLVVIAPLFIDAIRAGIDERAIPGTTAISEASNLLLNVAFVLVVFTIWLSLGPRHLIFTEIRQRRLIPIVLVVLAYVLGALVKTADAAERAAEYFLMGFADSSMAITLTLRDEAAGTIPDTGLLLVTARNGTYFVVEQQDIPASPQPVAYMIPFEGVESARVERVIPAGMAIESVDMLDGGGSPGPGEGAPAAGSPAGP